MTETSQQYHRPLRPLGQKGDILLPNPQRFKHFAPEPPAKLPDGIKGVWEPNPNFGNGSGTYEPLFHLRTVRADG